MNKPTITKVLIPAYKVTAETMRPNCKEMCDMEEGCRQYVKQKVFRHVSMIAPMMAVGP
jgi:hypothetical protein